MKRWRSVIAIMTMLIVMIVTVAPNYSAENADSFLPEGFDSWEDYYNELIGGVVTTVKVPPLHEMKLVGENTTFIFYYHEDGADAYVLDKRNQKLWSSAIHPDYMDTKSLLPKDSTMLLDVGIADETGANTFYQLTSNMADSAFKITPLYEKNKVILTCVVGETGVSFDFEMWIDEDGFNYSLPIEKVKETGAGKLTAITAMPSFGAASSQEDGYLFVPDGSGALIDIKKYDLPEENSYIYPLYGQSELDVEYLSKQNAKDLKSMMLPVVGIKHTKGAVLAAITEGAANSSINIQTGKTYRVSFQFEYRNYATVEYNFNGSVFEAKTLSELIPQMIEKNHTVKLFLLNETQNSYSDMAVTYRNFLVKSKVLKAQTKPNTVPLSIEFFMGIEKNGFLFKELVPMTTYSQVQNILKDLKEAGTETLEASLTGWCKGGYDTLPTAPKAESKLGGMKKLEELVGFCQQQQTQLFLNMDFVNAKKNSGQFNSKKEVLRNWLGKIVTNKEETRYLMNTVKTLDANIATIQKQKLDVGMHFTSLGSLVVPNNLPTELTNREKVVEGYQKLLESAKTESVTVAVSGGNSYVLPYVDRIYDIPDNDSMYYQNDHNIPFYQMVVHGYIGYSSLAGNMSHSIDYQKLKWIETGSIPHFLITEQNPVKLKDTSHNKIFSSEYKNWEKIMLDVNKEMNSRLKNVWNQTIDKHEWLSEEVVCITYANASETLINYSDNEVNMRGYSIPPMNYIVIEK